MRYDVDFQPFIASGLYQSLTRNQIIPENVDVSSDGLSVESIIRKCT